MNPSFLPPVSARTAQRLQRARAGLFVAALAAAVLALVAATAVRIAAPTGRLDLWLFLIGLACGILAALTATNARRTALVRRTLGSVLALGFVAYSVVCALRPPEVLSGESLVYGHWFPKPQVQADPVVYEFRETSNGRLGAKLPSGNGWRIDPPAEMTLQAVRGGLSVRVETASVLPGENANDVAERLLAELKAASFEAVTEMEYPLGDGQRDGVLEEIEVWKSEEASEHRLLAVQIDSSNEAVVVWMACSDDGALAHGHSLRVTLTTATVDPQRLASLRQDAKAKRTIADAPQRKVQRPYRSPRGGRSGALENISETLRDPNDSR